MDAVIRGTVIYAFLMLIFRISGKRTLADVTTFDFALLLIISETTQEAMIGNDHSITQSLILITTLVGADIGLSLVKQRWPRLGKWMDDVPLVIVSEGKPLKERMRRCRVEEDDVLHAARELQGLERMDQIKYAVLERGGAITIIAKETGQSS